MLESHRVKGLVAAVVLLAWSAPAYADGSSGAVLGARGVEGIARHAAKQWGEKHPQRIAYTTAALAPAMKVAAGEAPATPLVAPDSESPAGDPASLVDVVAVWGHFTANVHPPRGAKAPTGTVLELVVDAHTGAIESRSLSDRVRVPLSRLGKVHRLDLGPSAPHRHAH
jgi:hypothetical protein